MTQAYQKLGRYHIIHEIASGGMATVYRAKLIGIEGFEKDVAIKKILPSWSKQHDFVNMLIDEAKILVHLQHANIVQVFELAKEKDTYFIVMEYIRGFDLRTLLNKLHENKTAMPLDLACLIIKEICQALDFAHTRKSAENKPLRIVHRDISPQNIMIDIEGNVKVTDFGIANIIGKSTETAAGALKGKFSYMSPEQAMGKPVNLLTDIFATGALFYELLFQEKCFDGKNDLEIIHKVKETAYDLPETIHDTAKQILTKALSLNPEQRFQSAIEFKLAIKKLERDENLHTDQNDLKKFISKLFAQEIQQQQNSVSNLTQNNQDHTTQTRVHTESRSSNNSKPAKTEQNQNITILQPETIIDSQILSAPAQQKKSPLKIITDKISALKFNRTYTLSISALILVMVLVLFFSFWPSPQKTPAVDPASFTRNNDEKAKAPETLASQKKQNLISEESKFRNDLEQAHWATLSLQTEPSDAVITLNSDQTKTGTGSFFQEFPFENTEQLSVSVTISHPDYETRQEEFIFTKETLLRSESITLKPITFGVLKITARPWGLVKINDESKGQTPVLFKSAQGTYMVSVSYPPQKKTVQKTITLSPGNFIHCLATFSGSTNFFSCK